MGCSNDNYWKLDKWDKIGIASLIVFFTIFVVLNTFSFGAEVETVDTFSLDTVVSDDKVASGGTGTLIFWNIPNTRFGVYFPVKKGEFYTLSSLVDWTDFCFTYSVPDVGVSFFNYQQLHSSSYSFTSNFDGYVYLYSWSSKIHDIEVSSISGMQYSVSSLVSSFDLWDTFNKSIPFILVVVLVAFGIYLISHAIKEISKGRDV